MAKSRKKQMSEKLAASRKRSVVKTSSLFEQKFAKQKCDILGRDSKSKGIRCGKPNASKAKAFEKRQRTLGEESATVGKANRFVDRRLAEKWQGASKEEKMSKRFALVRRKRYAKEAFNLDDNENLTHYGQNLAHIEKFDKEPVVDLVDDEDAVDGGIFSATANFGGGDSIETPPKSRKAMINEMIAKSKLEKQEKQHQRQELRHLTDLLDEQWKLALESNLLGSVSSKKGEMGESVEIATTSALPEKDLKNGPKAAQKSADYDTLVKELAFDRRTGVAQDGVKSDEEIGRVEREKFEKLQADKLLRMRDCVKWTFGDERERETRCADEDHFNPDQLESGSSKLDRRTGCDRVLRYVDGVRRVASDEEAVEETEGLCEDSSEFDKVFDVKRPLKPAVTENEKVAGSCKEIDVLASYDQMKRTLVNLNDSQLSTRLQNLMKSLDPALKVGNKEKLQRLFLYSLQFFDHVSRRSPTNFKILDHLTSYLFKLKEYGRRFAGRSVKALLKKHRADFLASSKKFKKPAPSANVICFLRLVPHLFPATDFYHPVTTPSFLFLSEILRRFRLNSLRDVSVGLLICTIFVEYVAESNKFTPDVLHFLKHLLSMAFSPDARSKSPFDSALLQQQSSPISLSSVFNESGVKCGVNQSSCLVCALKLCTRLCTLYGDLPSWLDVFEPFFKILNGENRLVFGSEVADEVERFKVTFSDLRTNFSRQFLNYGAKDKKEFEFLEPRIEKNFNPDKKRFKCDKGPKAEREKLKKRYKREYKGTVRELRRDNEFLARRQLEQAMSKDQERRQKTKRLMASLMGQEADYKKMKRAKD